MNSIDFFNTLKHRIIAEDFLNTLNQRIITDMKREDIQLIGDISLDDDSYKRLEEEFSFLWEIDYKSYGRKYKESLILLLVKNAERNYSGNFWGHLKIDFNYNQRSFTRDLFLEICERYNFPTFETEAREGHGIITPYICHSGIPNEELPDFFATFENYFDNGNVQAFLNLIDQRHYLVRRHTERFLDYLDANRFPFLLQWEEITNLYNDDITTEEVFNQLKISFEGESILIPQRFIKHYIDWQRTPSDPDKPGRKHTRRHRYKSPYITFDFDARCLVLQIPEQEVPKDLNPDYQDKLVWIIEYADEDPIIIETFIHRNVLSNRYLTDAESLKLRQPQSPNVDMSNINVRVYFNEINQQLQSWELDFVSNEYIVFDDSGKIVHNNQVSKQNFMLFTAKHLKVVSGDASYDTNVVFWPDYRLSLISFGDLETVTIENRENGKRYSIEKKPGLNIPELQEGAVFYNNPSIYQELPLLVFLNNIDDSISVEIEHIESKDKMPVKDIEQKTKLSDVIDVNRYGTYSLRTRQANKTIDRKRFYYIPAIQFVDEGNYWPKPNDGYEPNSYYRFEASEDVQIDIDGLAKENELLEAGRRKVWFKSKTKEQKTRYHGKISLRSEFSDNNINVDFQIAARPILWTIESSADESQLKYTDKPIYLTNNQIRMLKEPYLFLSTGALGSELLQGKLIVVDGQGNDLLNIKIDLKNGGTFSYPLFDLLLNDAIQSTEQYQIGIQFFSPHGELIGGSTYPLVIVSPTIEYFDFNVEIQDSFIKFSWSDTGQLTERGLFLSDLIRPWKEVKYFPIFEDNTSINLPQTELEYGIYSAKIDIPKRQNPFGKLYFEPTVWSEKFPLHTPYEEEMNNSLESFNYYWLSYLLSENDTADFEDQKKLSPKPIIQDAQQAMNLVKTYLTIKTLESQTADPSEAKQQKFLDLERVYRNLARDIDVSTEDMLSAILNEGFSPKDYFDVFSFFELVQLTDSEIQSMNWIDAINKIYNQLPDLAFQIAMATNNYNYYQYVERWIKRYTLNELLELPRDEDPIETMQERIEDDRKMGIWASHLDYWGSYQDVSDFFDQHVKDSYKNKFKKMNDLEYFAYYESTYKKETRKLFGKSFLRKRQDLQNIKNSNEDKYNKLLKHMEDCVQNDIRSHYEELRNSFPIAMDRISKIIDFYADQQIAEDIIYNSYLIMFVVTLYRQGKWSHGCGSLLRNADRIRRYFPEMYNHTLVIFELYLRDGGQ